MYVFIHCYPVQLPAQIWNLPHSPAPDVLGRHHTAVSKDKTKNRTVLEIVLYHNAYIYLFIILFINLFRCHGFYMKTDR